MAGTANGLESPLPERNEREDAGKVQEEEEDDYMTMKIPSPPSSPKKETLTQRRKRLQREAEARAHQPSKAELARREAEAREAALATALPTESKGYKMMAKLGFKAGEKLGVQGNKNALTEPIALDIKEGRAGVGLDGERKRKIREEWDKREDSEKKTKVEEGDFRERIGREREEKRVEGIWWGGMRILEGLEEGDQKDIDRRSKKKVNLLYRPLVKERDDQEDERRARYDLLQSLSRDQNYADPEEDEQDRIAFGKTERDTDGEDEVDEALEAYMAMEPKERLQKLVKYLRDQHWYCFWCKTKYQEESMEGCPGPEEEDHD